VLTDLHNVRSTHVYAAQMTFEGRGAVANMPCASHPACCQAQESVSGALASIIP
jgi:hypothetical protein